MRMRSKPAHDSLTAMSAAPRRPASSRRPISRPGSALRRSSSSRRCSSSLPTAWLLVGAFQDHEGAFTLANIVRLGQPSIRLSYWLSIEVSAASAILGALIGLVLALAALRGGLPAWLRPTLMTFSGVASNFAGVPLAFAFLATLGRLGLVTVLLRRLRLRSLRPRLQHPDLLGPHPHLSLFPDPADGAGPHAGDRRVEARMGEAAEMLGASAWQYWRLIALPVLWPSILGAALLLFANAFGAIATAYALTGSSLNIVPILLYAQIRGDVLHDPNLGYALALGMLAITGASNLAYLALRARSDRWLR